MTFEQPCVTCFSWEEGEAEAKAEYSIHQTPVGFKGVFQSEIGTALLEESQVCFRD